MIGPTGPQRSGRRPVLVLGMHRSGTSAATRVVSLLGPALCRPEDLLRGREGNDRGHWECTPLVAVGERLLAELGSRWWCPPASLEQVGALAEDPRRSRPAREAVLAAHPRAPWVWKDPRNCVLLPFWRRVLPVDPVILLVLRHPALVAASLRARDRITVPFALAVWERHLTLALQAVAGLPVLTTTFTDLLADPVAWSQRTAAFLRVHDVEAEVPSDAAGIEAFVLPSAGSRDAREDDSLLSEPQAELWRRLSESARDGGVPEPPEPDPDTLALMEEARSAFGLRSGPPRAAGGSFVSRTGIRVLERSAPAPRRVAAPAVSVLLLPKGRTATRGDAVRLRPRLPAGAEIVTVASRGEGDPAEALGGTDDAPDWFVTIRREEHLTTPAALNLAAEVARGDVLVILAGPTVTPLVGWLPPLRSALAEVDCGVAAPAVYGEDGDEPVFGLAPSAGLLPPDWLVDGRARGRPWPVPAASSAVMATSRHAFESVGGFDDALTDGGGEDVDYCVRLWREGWRCVVAPESRVRMEFATLPATELDVLVNAVRLALVHLDRERLSERLGELASHPLLPRALASVTAGDAGRRRRIVDALSWYATDAVPEALNVRILPEPPLQPPPTLLPPKGQGREPEGAGTAERGG